MNSEKEIKEKTYPLEGIKIVEYGVFHAGPGGNAILGDLGAEIIKIESGSGDPMRHWVKVAHLDFALENGDNVMFETSNRNKKGIYLDIKKDKGRNIFNQMIKEADVFLTNLRKSTKKKLGIDYENIVKINDRIIHANVSGYGPEGPMDDLGAFDPLGQACSGMMYATGTSEPALISHAVLDQATAIALSHAVITALFHRERHGIGQEVHVSLYSTALWLQTPTLMISNVLAIDPCPPIARTEHSPLRNRFCCKDGNWIAGTNHPEERYWSVFCNLTGQSELIDNPEFTTSEGHPVASAKLTALFDTIFLTKTRDEWMDIFLSKGLMFSPVRQINEIQTDPQALANDYIVPFKHPVHGEWNVPGYPVHFSKCKAGMRSSAPSQGEHTDEILINMGYSEDEIKDLKTEGIIR